jgi:hypothetical protein
MADKIYVGNAKYKELPMGTITALGLSKDDLAKLALYLNENDWVNIDLKESKDGSPYMEINTYGLKNVGAPAATKVAVPADTDDDLPF